MSKTQNFKIFTAAGVSTLAAFCLFEHRTNDRKDTKNMFTPLDDTLAFRVDRQTKEAIERAAAAEDRKPGALARVLLREALRGRGLLATDEHAGDLPFVTKGGHA